MNIVVIGASRGIGLETVKAALAAGHSVRAMARSSIAITDPRVTKIMGDATSRADLEKAIAGGDVVIQALGLAMGPQYLTGTTLFSSATRALVEAMKATGLKRLIAVTGAGAGDSRGRLGFVYDAMFAVMLKRVYDDKDVQERIIRDSGLDWTIVRPGVLNDGAATGKPRALVDPKDWHAGPISRADVAAFLVKEAETATYRGKTPLLIA